MARIIWSPRAEQRLTAISEYYQLESPRNATATVDRLLASIERLQDFPNMGRVSADLPQPGARELLALPFRVLYAVNGNDVLIATILHTSMDVEAHLLDLLED